MAVVKAVSTLSTLLPHGGNAMRWSPITVATSWRKWGSIINRHRSIGGGLFASLTGQLRAYQTENGAYSRDSSRFPRRRPFFFSIRHTPSGQSRVYRVTRLRTDGVYCRELSGTEPVLLKVVPVTGVAILQVAMDQLMFASLFPHPLLV